MKAAVEEQKKSGVLCLDGMCLPALPPTLHTLLDGKSVTSLSAQRNRFTGLQST